MLLLLMRHGIAEDISADGSDAKRRLTQKGEREVREMARLLKKLGLVPTHVVASPRVRAHDTATIAAEIVGGGKLITLESLNCDGTWPEFVADVRKLTKGEKNAVVLAAGHEPNCGQFVTAALMRSEDGFHIGKGAVAALEWDGIIEPEGAELRFYLTHSVVMGLEE